MRRDSSVAVILVVVFWLQLMLTVPRLSATRDEVAHIAAGYSYWKTRDFRLNPEHPPLAKLLASLPLVFLEPKFDTSSPDWNAGHQWAFGLKFLCENGVERVLFWSRLPMTIVAAVGAVITFLWARALFGPAAALFALSLCTFSPNLLAHGMLVTTDVPLASFTILALYLFWKQGSSPSFVGSVGLGLALGAAVSTKFSGALLLILIVVLAGLRAWRSENLRAQLIVEAKALSITAVVTVLFVEATYLFAASPWAYVQGAQQVNANHDPKYLFYLLGNFRREGWGYYFLVAFLVKATVPVLVVTMLALIHLVTRGVASSWAEFVLLAGILLNVVSVSALAHPIGIRYLLPVLPLLFVWTSRIVPDSRNRPIQAGVLVLLVCWQAWAALGSFPNYIPYFNEIAGGPSRGIEYLDDSNVDWGQGMKQAARYVREHGLDGVEIFPFSPVIDPQCYGLPAARTHEQIWELLLLRKPKPGVYIISAHHLPRMRRTDPAWHEYLPIDRIGESLWVYRF